MFTLVRRARQRLLYNELLSQGANASSAALVAFILLLLFGTPVLNWQWALAIPLVAAAVGLYVARRRLPSLYTVAQMVDRRCALADTLSTALFFSQRRAAFPRFTGNPPIPIRAGRPARADRRCPQSRPLHHAAHRLSAGGAAGGGCSLFALRYGLSRRLDLKPPLARILQQKFGGNEPTEQARDARPKAPENPDSRDDGDGAVLRSGPSRRMSASEPIQDTGTAASQQRLR